MKKKDIITADNQIVHTGEYVFNYYDMEWGDIEEDSLDDQGWFTFRCADTGRRCSLNGERISTIDPREKK